MVPRPRSLHLLILGAAILCVAAAYIRHLIVDPEEFVETNLTITAQPVPAFLRADPKQVTFGRLTYRGGLELRSPKQRRFGGWSGLVLDEDGKTLVAVSDRGAWLMATLDYAGDTLSGVSNARMGPLLARDGVRLDRARDRDAESIALVDGKVHAGNVLVGFEQHNRIARYDVSSSGFSPERALLEIPNSASNMRRNNGFEAMTVMRGGPFKGSPIAVSERLYDPLRNHTGWIWTDRGQQPFHITNIGDFDITDIASLNDGTLFVLERRFRWLEGVKMRIRRISAADLQPGKTIDGETLIAADLNYEIDNMEGLAVSRDQNGALILTLLSDNNFNASMQRTLLLQFTLNDATAQQKPGRSTLLQPG